MSLVVAESTDDGPRIVSDTRVTLPETEAGRPSFRRDTLKAIVLSREAVVCFAGDVIRGLRSVREAAVALASGEPPDSLVHILFESIQDTSKEVEFVVALLNNPWQLARVDENGPELELYSTWIGDQLAFEAFQHRRHEPDDPLRAQVIRGLPQPTTTMVVLGEAMEAVIRDPSVKSVDGSRRGRFHVPCICFHACGPRLHHGSRDLDRRDGPPSVRGWLRRFHRGAPSPRNCRSRAILPVGAARHVVPPAAV